MYVTVTMTVAHGLVFCGPDPPVICDPNRSQPRGVYEIFDPTRPVFMAY